MHKIIDDVIHLCLRDAGLELDPASARLALVVVVDHLPGVLRREELAELEAALPLTLSLMLQRSVTAGHGRLPIVEPALVDVVCSVLSRTAIGDRLAHRLRGSIPLALGGGVVDVGAPARSERPSPLPPAATGRPTIRVVTPIPAQAIPPGERPTVRGIRAA